MLSPDFVMRVIPPTVTITATAPAVPNSQAATGLLLTPCFPAAAAVAAAEVAPISPAALSPSDAVAAADELPPFAADVDEVVRIEFTTGGDSGVACLLRAAAGVVLIARVRNAAE